MAETSVQPAQKKVGVGAYIALALAVIFFSGTLASTQWWGVFDFTTMAGGWGKLVSKATIDGSGVLQTSMSNLRGAGGSGAIDGFCFAFTLIPTVMFAIAMVTVFEFYGALEAARVLLTPILKPVMGIPGTTALAMISSMQSTDGGAALTRQLRETGALTDKEAYIFAAFQLTADAPLGNFLSSGAILFTLVASDGKPIMPVSIGLCLGIILLGKVVAAEIMRFLLIRMSNKKAA